MIYLLIVVTVCSLITAALAIHSKRKMYCMTDKMLTQMLEHTPIDISDVNEGALSAIASKIIRIQEKSVYELEKTEHEKEQLNRMISDISHQLKTPLSSVIMYCDMLASETDASNRQHFNERMRYQLDKLDWILQSMFKMIRLEQNSIQFTAEKQSLKDTLLSALNSTYEKFESKDITVKIQPFEDRCVWHNRKWTAEVFVNIIENAIKYSEKGSIIDIEVRQLEMFTEIRFIDHGMGIRHEELTEIFKRFYRSKDAENIEGSGIGLYLSRLILDQEKGYISVTSEYGKGSCFSVFLQNCQDQSALLSAE